MQFRHVVRFAATVMSFCFSFGGGRGLGRSFHLVGVTGASASRKGGMHARNHTKGCSHYHKGLHFSKPGFSFAKSGEGPGKFSSWGGAQIMLVCFGGGLELKGEI